MYRVKYIAVAGSEDKVSERPDQDFSDESQHEFIGSRWRSLRERVSLNAPYICFCLSTCFLLVAIILFSLAAMKLRSSGPKLPKDYFPQFPTTTMMFEDNEDFMGTGYKAQQAWAGMFPVGAGYFNITNPEKWGLPKSAPADAPDTYTYAVSVTHQLHCLAILREVMISYKNGTAFSNTKWAHEGEGIHAFHCVDYIRQGILCASDTSIEWGHSGLGADGKVHGFAFSGEGTIHQCQDWNSVKGFLEDNRASNKHTVLEA